jgi:hypothetical protein
MWTGLVWLRIGAGGEHEVLGKSVQITSDLK